MLFQVRAHDLVQVRHQPVDQVKAQGAGKNARHRNDDAVFPAVLQRGQHKTQHRRRQHHACSKGQNDVTKPMGYLFKCKAQYRA